MTIKYERGSNYGRVVDDMIAIKDEEEAEEYFEAVVQEAMTHDLSREDAIARARGNLGYLMGYAPTKIDCAMWEKVGCSHPVFGSMADGVQMTTEEILEAGKEAGRKAQG